MDWELKKLDTLLKFVLCIFVFLCVLELEKMRKQTDEIFRQVRWMTWKMDQTGSDAIEMRIRQ